MWKRVDGKRTLGLADPGAFRDELNALVLAGPKTATAGLSRVDYEPDGEHIEEVGEQLVVLDSDDEPLAVVEVIRVEAHPFTSVPWELARDEGEGFETIDDFRAGYRREYGKQGIAIVDDDIVICIWFRLVRRFAAIDRAL